MNIAKAIFNQLAHRTAQPGSQKGPISSERPRNLPQKARSGGALHPLIKAVWTVTVLIWPIARWIIAIEVGIEFFQMVWYWHTPGMHPGWTFLLHFGILSALTYFVGVYEPKRA